MRPIPATLWLALMVAPAAAQDHHHPPQDAQIHDQFYSKWNRPDLRQANGQRYYSCCNKQDCFPVTQIRPGRSGAWEVLDRDGVTWVRFPPEKVEQAQPDPVESPDGRTHACILPSTKTPLCLVLGSEG